MDPFRSGPSGGSHHAFRMVPMTHLATSSAIASARPLAAASDDSASSGAQPALSLLLRPLDSEETARNLRKWQQFGLQVEAPPPRPPSAPSSAATLVATGRPPWASREGRPRQAPDQRRLDNAAPANAQQTFTRRAGAPAAAVVVVLSDEDDEPAPAVLSRSPVPHQRPQASHRSAPHIAAAVPAAHSPLPAAPHPCREAEEELARGDATADASRRLQLELAKLSEKVQHSAEELRCGPPKSAGGGSASSPPSTWGAKRWGGKKGQAPKKAKAAGSDGEDEGKAGEDETSEDEATTVDAARRSTSGSGGRAKAARRKRGRAATGPGPADDDGDDEKNEGRGTGKRKPRTRGGAAGRPAVAATMPGAVGPSQYATPAPRTLFSLTAGSPSGGAAAALAGLPAGPTAAATVSVPLVYLQTSSDALFHDVRRALHDPDRIQAPPLFVGLSALSGRPASAAAALVLTGVECRTNFTYHGSGAKTGKRRASSCFTSADPTRSHQHVELVVVRWKDEVYALPAQTVGLAFLCRVLAELPGVELITFNAQVLLVALLAYCKGTLWSHCISDVRVMAWMAQLHIAAAATAASREQPSLRGGGDAVAEADAGVLYDYEQLLLQVCGGRAPPTVQLEAMSGAECFSRGSVQSPVDGTGASFAAASADATPPPLTPAQRQLAQQVYYLATVYRSLYGLLGSKGLLQAFLRQEKRIALLLALLKYNGMGVDLHEVHRYQASCEAEMARQRRLAAELVPELGDEFNIQSHDQCRKALYEVLQLGKFLLKPGSGEAAGATGLTITKGGRLSTAEDTLRALAQHHEFPACLLRYRKASKLMQTYVEGMMGYAVVRSGAGPCAADGEGELQEVEGAAPTTPPPCAVLGETVDVNRDGDDDSPFVDRWLAPRSRSTSNSNSNTAPRGPPRHGGGDGADAEASRTMPGVDVLPHTGYATLHANFLQEGTDTGRLSCVEPNLQNLPRNGLTAATAAPAPPPAAAVTDPASDGAEEGDGEEDLMGFRRCFVAAPGCVLVSIDYQQIELRVLAHLCGDAALVKALTTSADIHRAIAEEVFKKKPVSPEERSLAKRVVFGVLYGAGPKTLAAHMGVTVECALHITSLLTNAFPGIDTYHRRVVEESRASGFVRTLSGRLRYLPDICSTVMARRSYAERQAFNSVVQGSAADIMKMSMLAVAKEVLQLRERSDVCLLSQIHDEMVFMVRKEVLPTVVPQLSSAMAHAMQLLVPLCVTVKLGPSLGELREWSVDDDLGLGPGM